MIYIDPPFATKSDFTSWQWEKAYSDKVAWADFVEFVRKRLVLMRELLADDGSIYVHLDYKKIHYIKVLMDEIFWEHNLVNEIIWCYTWPWSPLMKQFNRKHDNILWYWKTNKRIFNQNDIRVPYKDPNQSLRNAFWEWFSKEDIEAYRKRWKIPETWWDDFSIAVRSKNENLKYPTQKPEKLLERIIKASSNEWDIVLDAFSWSWTTLAVAEKLWRKWIGVDWGKLSIYTIQNRLMNLKEEMWNKWKKLKAKPFAVWPGPIY